MKRAFTLTFFAAVATTVTAVLVTPPADAVDRRHVCWSSLWVRDVPAGAPIAVLYKGETFDRYYSTTHNNAVWSKGFAWGGENKVGWVQHAGLTNASDVCP